MVKPIGIIPSFRQKESERERERVKKLEAIGEKSINQASRREKNLPPKMESRKWEKNEAAEARRQDLLC